MVFRLFNAISDMNINGKMANKVYYYGLLVFSAVLFFGGSVVA